jgi:transaldolase
VDPEVVEELLGKFPDFRRAYNEDGLSLSEFDTYGPTVRTLRQFLEATHELAVRVRDLLLPNPDGAIS